MARKVMDRSRKPKRVVERNIALLEQVMRYLLSDPQTFDALPANFELVILPDDDPELRLYNLSLLDTYGSEGKPVVFARLKSSQTAPVGQLLPSLYVPLAV